MENFNNKTVWIVGASSGIGEALAGELNARRASLVLSARREDELAALNRRLGGGHQVMPLDVTNLSAMTAVAQNIGTIDCAIYLAALYTPQLLEDMDMQVAHQTLETNVMGALNFVHAVYAPMRRQKHGQIALCGSVAVIAVYPLASPMARPRPRLSILLNP